MRNSNYDCIVQYIVDNQEKFYRLAYSYTRNKDSALDIVQNAICKALEHYESIRNIDFIKTWFYRVLVNESLSYIRNNKKEVACDYTQMEEPVYYESGYESTDNLYNQINMLTAEVQLVIKLRFYEDMTLKEIAAITNTNLNTVKTRLYTGLKQLRIQLEEVAQ